MFKKIILTLSLILITGCTFNSKVVKMNEYARGSVLSNLPFPVYIEHTWKF